MLGVLCWESHCTSLCMHDMATVANLVTRSMFVDEDKNTNLNVGRGDVYSAAPDKIDGPSREWWQIFREDQGSFRGCVSKQP